MKLLTGKAVAESVAGQMQAFAAEVREKLHRQPRLVIFRCGSRPGDISYEKSLIRRAERFGVEIQVEAFPEKVSDTVFQNAFHTANTSSDVDGILLFRPLPKHLNEGFLLSCIDAEKDVDGTGPVNTAALYFGTECFAPCTAQAVVELLHFYQIPLLGKHVVILGRSNVVGKPLSMLLLREDATVTVCHSRTVEPAKLCRKADILVAATGCGHSVTADYIRKGAVVVDVGMSEGPDGKLIGDVSPEAAAKKASAYTPVPGGVGLVTSSVLLKYVILAAHRKIGRTLLRKS